MNSRWYISTLIILLTLLGGIASKQHASVPNQEIVLQFTSDEVTSIDTQNTIAIVKQQLQTAGVENIQVLELESGQLKISYYSNSDVASIKALLSKEKVLDIAYSSQDGNQGESPSEDKSIIYNVDVYEIQHGDDVSDLEGKLALETKVESDRFFNPNVFISKDDIDEKELNRIVSVAYKFHSANAITLDNRLREIPEVRAGPVFDGICDLI
ncbi:hypothetical protein A9Q86_10155 [Flavobacteriales bacterium 33_180_T64]|nr:hypothetical protein A9Q86_10155 [Flavobacteriales bacterium 33_180_T64]